MFNFKKKSEKDKEGKEKKEEKRRREKDRKARAERTLSGRDMAGAFAGSRENDGTQGVTKREKHGFLHSLRKHDRKSQDLSETVQEGFPNGEDTSPEAGEEQSVHSRVSAFENFSVPPDTAPIKPQRSSVVLQNGSDLSKEPGRRGNGSLERQEGSFKKVKTRSFDLEKSSPAVVDNINANGRQPFYNNQLSNEAKQKQRTSVEVKHHEIKAAKMSPVMSEVYPHGSDGKLAKSGYPPKVSSSGGKSYNSSLVVAPTRKGSTTAKQPEMLSPTERPLDVKGVSLALPALNPAAEGLPRNCSLRRQSNGGFGFALRRSTTSDNKEIYLAEPLAETTSSCLLPGDKLLEVNGVNVGSLTREKIVELVASSGTEVQLKVVPVPELAELTVRSGLDGGRVQVDETFLRSGSLARSGSKRMKKKTSKQGMGFTKWEENIQTIEMSGDRFVEIVVPYGTKVFSKPVRKTPFSFTNTKTEAEVASEREWLEAEKVWVVHKGGFSGGRMLKSTTTSPHENEAMCKVKLDHGGEIVNIDEDSIEKANPPQYDRAEDLSALRHLNEPSCLHAIRQRFGSSLIHSYAGQILIIINPLKNLSIYTDKVIQMFRGCKQEDMPPHIYASAQTTYRNMLATNSDQSLVLMGPSGSGKSVNCAHLLHYFCSNSVSPHSSLTDVKGQAMLILLDAFGTCSTRLNNNASRFTMLFTLDYDSSGLLTSGSLQTFLLEKTRIVRKPDQESNFKVFDYFMAGCNKKLRQEFHLDAALHDANAYINYVPDNVTLQKDVERWNELQNAFELLGASVSEMKSLWSIIAAIYHLGTAGVTMGNDNKPRFANPAGTQRAAVVLGISVEEIAELIFTPPVVSQIIIRSPRRKAAGRLSTSTQEASTVDEPPTMDNQRLTQCNDALEGLAVGLYQEAFGILVYLINRSIQEGDPRRIASVNILDSAGFSDATSLSSGSTADFEDFCHNYQSERFQKFFHNMMFTQQLDRYSQENVDCTFDSVSGSPERIVTMIDKAAQGGGMKMDLRNEKKGLLWLLDEESIFPGSTAKTFLQRLCDQRQGVHMFKAGPNETSFYLHHFQARQPTLYNARGWLKLAREHPAIKQAHILLAQSSKDDLVTLSLRHADGLSRTRSFYRKVSNTTMSVKKNSQCLQLIYQVDNVLDCIRKTHISFIRCMSPVSAAGKYDLSNPVSAAKAPASATKMDVPLLRDQLKRAQVLDAVRLHRQGYPEHMTFGEFQHRFSILTPAESRAVQPVLDEKKAAESLLQLLDVDDSSYRIGLSQIFMRAGTLAQLEDARDETITDNLIELQALCRGYLSRKKLQKLKVQQKAIKCIQRNVRQFLTVREWDWWRLYTKIVPLLDIHRTEVELKAITDELDLLKHKVTKLESDKELLLDNNTRLEQKVSELSTLLDDERASGHGTSAMLQEEQVMRIRAEKEFENFKTQMEATKKIEKEREVIRAETVTMTEAAMDEAEVSGDTPPEQNQARNASQASVNDLDEQLVQMSSEKRRVDRQLSEKDSHNEELVREMSNLKRKITRTSGEMNDMKLLLEKSQSRNAELEKKQRRFDADLARAKEESQHEHALKETALREKGLVSAERLQLESELERYKREVDEVKNEKQRLEYDLTDLGKNKDGAKVVQMASSKRQLEKKIEEQDEELDEQAGQIQLLEQAKLKLEMEIEQAKKRSQKEADRNEEDTEEMKSNYTRKIKQLEAQLEDEHHEVSQSVKAKNESDRKVMELRNTLEHLSQSSGKRYKQDLKNTKALLRDAQHAIDQLNQQATKDRILMKQLKHQLEDQHLATATGLKSKKQLELEVQEIQAQYDAVIRTKIEVEEKCSGIARENNELKSHIEEDEEEMNTLLQKNKTAVTQIALVQIENAELVDTKQELQKEKRTLTTEIADLKHRLSYFEETSVERNVHDKVGSKVKELEQKLESSTANLHRVEVQNERLKEALHKTEEEKTVMVEKESKFQQEKNKMDKKISEMKEEFEGLEKQENEQKKRRMEKESDLEEMDIVLSATKSDLTITKKRLVDLQQAMEENLNYDSDGVSDTSSDEDDEHDSLSSHRTLSESRVSSEPRSYKSYEDLDEVYDVSDRLAQRLNALEEPSSPTSPRSNDV